MDDFAEIIESVLGGGDNITGQARDVLTGGCLGFLMSGLLLFLFFTTGIIWFTGDVEGITIDGAAVIPILVLLLAALASPIVGAAWGMRRGYRITRHLGCFLFFVLFALAAVALLSTLT